MAVEIGHPSEEIEDFIPRLKLLNTISDEVETEEGRVGYYFIEEQGELGKDFQATVTEAWQDSYSNIVLVMTIHDDKVEWVLPNRTRRIGVRINSRLSDGHVRIDASVAERVHRESGDTYYIPVIKIL